MCMWPLMSWSPMSWRLHYFRFPTPGAHSPSGFTGPCPSLVLRAAALGQACVKSPQPVLRELVSRKNHSSI